MRGGKRDGAGRPPGSSNTATAASKAALADLAAGYVEGALVALADIAANGTSDAARVSAAVAILDRCYGRPSPMPPGRTHGAPPYAHDDIFDLQLGNW
jgi:hypothetical protein